MGRVARCVKPWLVAAPVGLGNGAFSVSHALALRRCVAVPTDEGTEPMKAIVLAAAGLACLLALPGNAEASHRRDRSMAGWCRADAAQMMGVSRRAVVLENRVLRTEAGRYQIRGLAAHGALGSRTFTCHFNARGVLQGAV